MTDTIGYIVILSVAKETTMPLDRVDETYSRYNLEQFIPTNRKMSNLWERVTNVSTTFRKDIKFSEWYKDKGLKVRFYTSKVKSSIGDNGILSRQLVMEVINPSASIEYSHDISNLSDARYVADQQRINRPISIMRFNALATGPKSKFFWADENAKSGHNYLADGEAERVVAEIKNRLAEEMENLTNREIWKSIKLMLESMKAYSLNGRGGTYFIPVSHDLENTKTNLRNIMDFVNSIGSDGKSSATVFAVTQDASRDEFGSASVVLQNSLTDLSDRIARFCVDAKTKRVSTLRTEWDDIQEHVKLFRAILGDKLTGISENLSEAVAYITTNFNLDLALEIDEEIEAVINNAGAEIEIDIPTWDTNEETSQPDEDAIWDGDSFEIELDF